MSPTLTLVVPCFQAATYINSSVTKIADYLKQHDTDRVIFIDDGCTDRTFALLNECCKIYFKKNRWTVLRHELNQGKGAAILDAFASVETELCCFIDADVVYDLSNCDAFRTSIQQGEILIANRIDRQSLCTVHPDLFKFVFFRHISSRIFNAIVRLLLIPGIKDIQAGLKMAYTNDIRQIIERISMHRFAFDTEFIFLAHQSGLSIKQLPVHYTYVSNRSTIRFFRDALCMSRDLITIKMKKDYRFKE